jgi:hypothetical protein
MSMVTQGYISDLFFGFDPERLLLRLDSRGGPFREQLAEVQAIRLVFVQPEGLNWLSGSQPQGPEVQVATEGSPDRTQRCGRHLFELAFRSEPARRMSRSTSMWSCSRTSSPPPHSA